ncbi:MAG: hypothetical protein BWY04_01009 [candidate division CPR1 bacterium ADurb.Bin160]|uniref:Uncharacterized protein n=1 Tax=candidate division CPR1 bacterium ADurb.Bin160 TaxID=1852826 RepID=A0A1V5ZLP7_9BACT|nr:MAG: hypothetical protein BWY04_01009 [candidate division CPR1 bacterium ADurb.Bin160]
MIENRKPKIYLLDSGDGNFLELATSLYSNNFFVVNPNKEIPKTWAGSLIFETEKTLIKMCDYMIVNLPKEDIEISLKIYYAHTIETPCFVVNENGKFFNYIWLGCYVTKFFDDMFSCFEFLKNERK